MGSKCLVLGLLILSGSKPPPAPSYNGTISLPVDLYSSDGTHLEKGQYAIEVKLEKDQYTLLFLQNDQAKSSIKGELLQDDESDEHTALPLVGTLYLRSSADPVGSEAERHFSKSGLPQYEEENREWKATLRIYTTRDRKEALCLFEEKQKGGKWAHVQFKLYLNPR